MKTANKTAPTKSGMSRKLFLHTSLLGVLAVRVGGRIEWDAKNFRITNRPELNAFLRDPVRKGWEYGEALWKGLA